MQTNGKVSALGVRSSAIRWWSLLVVLLTGIAFACVRNEDWMCEQMRIAAQRLIAAVQQYQAPEGLAMLERGQ